MYCLFSYLLAFLSLLTKESVSELNSRRVVRGYEVDIKLYPHAVFLYFDISRPSTCGSSLITTKAVVTSAHCLREMTTPKGRVQAFMGASVPILATVVRNVTSFKVHDKYNPNKGTFDLGLAKFDREVPMMRNLHKIPIYTESLHLNETLFTAGWGKKWPTDFPDYSNTRHIKATKQRLVASKECFERAGIKLSTNGMCSVPIRGYHYRGDLGNGLVTHTRALAGVVSFMVRDVTLYANLVSQRSWLRMTLKKLYGKETLDAGCC